MLGTLIGALIIQLVRYTLLANGVPDAAALVVKAGHIVLAVWLQRQVGVMNELARSSASRSLAPRACWARLRCSCSFRRAALRRFPQRIQHSDLPALQLDVRADRARHVLCHHDWRDRSFGRLDRGFGERRCGPFSPYGLLAGAAAGMGAGYRIGLLNGLIVTRLRIPPFIATLATMLAASGTALLVSGNQSLSVSYDSGFTDVGQGDFLGFPIPAWIAAIAYRARLGHAQLHAVRAARAGGRRRRGGGATDGPAGRPGQHSSTSMSGALAGLAGVILAAQFGAGQPTEGVGWELFAIASVVLGGTLLTGGMGSVMATLAGVMLLGLIFNLLNFENGMGWISLRSYWQSVIRGALLLFVVVLQSRLTARNDRP